DRRVIIERGGNLRVLEVAGGAAAVGVLVTSNERGDPEPHLILERHDDLLDGRSQVEEDAGRHGVELAAGEVDQDEDRRLRHRVVELVHHAAAVRADHPAGPVHDDVAASAARAAEEPAGAGASPLGAALAGDGAAAAGGGARVDAGGATEGTQQEEGRRGDDGPRHAAKNWATSISEVIHGVLLRKRLTLP